MVDRLLRRAAPVLVLTAVLGLGASGPAQAHKLKLVKAHDASEDSAAHVCEYGSPGVHVQCTGFQVAACQRVSAHRVRCLVQMQYFNLLSGESWDCSYTDEWKIGRDSERMRWVEGGGRVCEVT